MNQSAPSSTASWFSFVIDKASSSSSENDSWSVFEYQKKKSESKLTYRVQIRRTFLGYIWCNKNYQQPDFLIYTFWQTQLQFYELRIRTWNYNMGGGRLVMVFRIVNLQKKIVSCFTSSSRWLLEYALFHFVDTPSKLSNDWLKIWENFHQIGRNLALNKRWKISKKIPTISILGRWARFVFV